MCICAWKNERKEANRVWNLHTSKNKRASKQEKLPALQLPLNLRAEVLNLAKDDVRVRRGALEHIGSGNGKESVLALLDGHAGHASQLLQAQLLHCLACLLLTSALE